MTTIEEEPIIYLLDFGTLEDLRSHLRELPESVESVYLDPYLSPDSKRDMSEEKAEELERERRISLWGQVVEYTTHNKSNPLVDEGWVWNSFLNGYGSLYSYVKYVNSGVDLAYQEASDPQEYLGLDLEEITGEECATQFYNTGYHTRLVAMVEKIPVYGYLDTPLVPRYTTSLRPKTSMKFLETRPPPVDLRGFQATQEGVIQKGSTYYLPVVRYALGMNQGGYFLESPEDDESAQESYLGTFYYLERESSFVLAFAGYRTFRNKSQCCYFLAQEVPNGDPYLYQLGNMRMKPFSDFLGVKEAEAVSEAAMDFLVFNKPIRSRNRRRTWNPQTHTDQDNQYISELYALEDSLDQTICQLARLLDIQVIILTHMPGHTRLVQEVLDARDRPQSFQSLYSLI